MITEQVHTRSRRAFTEAQAILPGGVNSPVRAFKSVGGEPLFIARGAGSRIWDVDGNEYIDHVLSWGPLILGHAHEEVVARTIEALQKGTSFGAPTRAETELAAIVTELVPTVEMIRLVSSGTEATMSALRLARAATGRAKIVKFSGCYHGHSDLLLVKAGSGVATLGLPDSPGVPPGAVADTLVADYNDLGSVSALCDRYPGEIAAVIVEPVVGNMGVVPPVAEFLPGLRALTQRHGALLIFDEVMTGFRVALGGAVAHFGVQPDLITFGKVIGGGFPLAAYAGSRELMELVAPVGPVYQAGTLSGNPVATAAGIATLTVLRQSGVFPGIAAKTTRLMDGIDEAARAVGVPIQTAAVGTMAGFFLNAQPVKNYDDAVTSDTGRYARLFRALLRRGINIAPSQFEAMFLSAAHSDADIERTVTAFAGAFAEIGLNGSIGNA